MSVHRETKSVCVYRDRQCVWRERDGIGPVTVRGVA